MTSFLDLAQALLGQPGGSWLTGLGTDDGSAAPPGGAWLAGIGGPDAAQQALRHSLGYSPGGYSLGGYSLDAPLPARGYTVPKPPAAPGAPAPAPADGQLPAAPGAPSGDTPFFQQFRPIAQQVEHDTGVPAALNLAVASNETGGGQAAQGGQRWNSYHGIRGTGSAGQTPGGFRAYATPAESFQDFAHLITDPTTPYAGAWGQYQQDHDVAGLARNIAQAGYASSAIREGNGRTEAANWADQIARLLPQAAGAPSGAVAAPGDVTHGINQFTLPVDPNTAAALCGPTAALWFAQKMGRTPTLDEALALARQVGWTPQAPNGTGGGMAGPQSEVALLQQLGLPAHGEAPNWDKIAQEVQAGRPVILDTPDHYYQIVGYDAPTGRFDLGGSALALRASQGRTWYRPDEIAGLGMGAPRTAIYLGGP